MIQAFSFFSKIISFNNNQYNIEMENFNYIEREKKKQFSVEYENEIPFIDYFVSPPHHSVFALALKGKNQKLWMGERIKKKTQYLPNRANLNAFWI